MRKGEWYIYEIQEDNLPHKGHVVIPVLKMMSSGTFFLMNIKYYIVYDGNDLFVLSSFEWIAFSLCINFVKSKTPLLKPKGSWENAKDHSNDI